MGGQRSTIEILTVHWIKTSDPEIMGNKFNDYFTNIDKSLADNIPIYPTFTFLLKHLFHNPMD